MYFILSYLIYIVYIYNYILIHIYHIYIIMGDVDDDDDDDDVAWLANKDYLNLTRVQQLNNKQTINNNSRFKKQVHRH